jgi:hypothetical protein
MQRRDHCGKGFAQSWIKQVQPFKGVSMTVSIADKGGDKAGKHFGVIMGKKVKSDRLGDHQRLVKTELGGPYSILTQATRLVYVSLLLKKAKMVIELMPKAIAHIIQAVAQTQSSIDLFFETAAFFRLTLA